MHLTGRVKLIKIMSWFDNFFEFFLLKREKKSPSSVPERRLTANSLEKNRFKTLIAVTQIAVKML